MTSAMYLARKAFTANTGHFFMDLQCCSRYCRRIFSKHNLGTRSVDGQIHSNQIYNSTQNIASPKCSTAFYFGCSAARLWTRLKLNVLQPKSFCRARRHLNPRCFHILPWLASGSVVSYLLFKGIAENSLLIRPFQCAKCDTSLDSPASLAIAGSDLCENERRNFLRWLIQDFIPLMLRATQLFCFFTPLLMTYPLTYLGPSWFELWLHVLYVAVEHSGATFIKLGQWASTRRDLFSKQVCDKFAHLHFQVRPHAWSHTAHSLHEAYGEGWQDMLHLVEGQKPVGSGCIAQVYKGYLNANLEGSKFYKDERTSWVKDRHMSNSIDLATEETNVIPIAIKVLHPGVQSKFRRDMILMSATARCLTWLFPRLHWVNLNQCVSEFRAVMQAQLDMRQECLCLQKFTKNFASCDQICVPKPFPDLVRHNILVETFEEGVSLGEIVQDSSQPAELKKKLGNMGVHMMLQMVFVNNFVHADLHPGNLLVQNLDNIVVEDQDAAAPTSSDETLEDFRPMTNGKEGPRLVLLDCGITASLGPEDRHKFTEVFTAVVKGEGETVADLFLSKSAVNQCEDPALFRQEMAQLVTEARQNLVSISKIKVAELMNSVFSVLSRHRIQLEANFASVILAMAMLEGLGRSLNPDLDLLEKARPVLLGTYLGGNSAGA